MHATEFIITNYMLQGYEAYLTPQQILEMDKSGLITFGAHTKDHPDLTKLAKKTVFNEIKGSKNDLEFLLKKPIHWFAYPYGAYNESVIQTVRSAGFEGALSTIIGSSQTINTIFLMPRIMVDGRWDVQTFIKNIQNK
jgi:peptidoglycan/xylan/chitin deacetylase (PgdA/CDA1 family)